MRLGFLLDSGACIGCHACTVACKSEHHVPVGVNRTWVNYVESGEFPDVRRDFTVMRCNQCDDAPCIKICPTGSLFRASNGVVDFDSGRCIGCKGCMNACPYDALYIDPVSNTAHKCNFCNHKVEVGLEPACVTACPTEAIVVVDHDDDTSAAAQRCAELPVRAPEQGTLPKVVYAGVDAAALDPLSRPVPRDGLIWAQLTDSSAALSAPAAAGSESSSNAAADARTTYTTGHSPPWGRRVSSYLLTKGAAVGLMGLAAVGALADRSQATGAAGVTAAAVAIVLLAATGALLIADLKRPDRWWYLLAKGRWGSWIVRGAYVLAAQVALAFAWLVAAAAGWEGALVVLAVPVLLGSVATACYTAALFSQCEGRDLLQRRRTYLLFALEAAVAGAAVSLLLDVFDVAALGYRWQVGGGALVLLIGFTAVEHAGHWRQPVGSNSGQLRAGVRAEHVRRALSVMLHGRPKLRSRLAAVATVGALLALLLGWALTSPESDPWLALGGAAGLAALAAVWLHDDALLEAGQSVPLS